MGKGERTFQTIGSLRNGTGVGVGTNTPRLPQAPTQPGCSRAPRVITDERLINLFTVLQLVSR